MSLYVYFRPFCTLITVRIPVIGGSYIYIYSSSGELLGFLSGFVKVSTQMCSCAINAISAVAYLCSFIQSLSDNDTSTDSLDDSIFFGRDLCSDIVPSTCSHCC